VNELPICRHFIACERVEQTADRSITLHRLSSRVIPTDGEAYPLVRPNQCFLAVLTSGTGRHTIWVEAWLGVGPYARLVWRSPPGTIQMGNDPLAIGTVAFRFTLAFETPGQYEYRLMGDGLELAREFLDARE